MALSPGSGRPVGSKAINFPFPAPFTHFVRELSQINLASVLCYFLLASKESNKIKN